MFTKLLRNTLKTQFSGGLFSKDTAGASMEAIDPSTCENKGSEVLYVLATVLNLKSFIC